MITLCYALRGLALALYGAWLLFSRITLALLDDLLVAGGWKWRPSVGLSCYWRKRWRAPWR